jgi:hypothetical protein
MARGNLDTAENIDEDSGWALLLEEMNDAIKSSRELIGGENLRLDEMDRLPRREAESSGAA